MMNTVKFFTMLLSLMCAHFVADAQINWFDYSNSAIKMDIENVNNWNEAMWDIGYSHDCQLDGWQVGY